MAIWYKYVQVEFIHINVHNLFEIDLLLYLLFICTKYFIWMNLYFI